jgi:hypothetical protein
MYCRTQESPGLHSGLDEVKGLKHQGRSDSAKRSAGEGYDDTTAWAVGGGHLTGIE